MKNFSTRIDDIAVVTTGLPPSIREVSTVVMIIDYGNCSVELKCSLFIPYDSDCYYQGTLCSKQNELKIPTSLDADDFLKSAANVADTYFESLGLKTTRKVVEVSIHGSRSFLNGLDLEHRAAEMGRFLRQNNIII